MVIMGEWGDKLGDLAHTHTRIKETINKDLLYSTGNSTQSPLIIYMGKESEKEWIYAWV